MGFLEGGVGFFRGGGGGRVGHIMVLLESGVSYFSMEGEGILGQVILICLWPGK